MTLLQALIDRLPRRKRLWKYVSPRRRGAGMVLLAMLLGAIYLFWYFTNDTRIRKQAEQYLQKITGGDVRIGMAHLHLFGGVELRNVRVRVPGADSSEPFFSAQSLRLRHKPWMLLVGKFEPEQIDCEEPSVLLVHDPQQDTYAEMKLLEIAGQGNSMSAALDMPLPSIRVNNLRLRVIQKMAGLRQVGSEQHFNMSLQPAGPREYQVLVQEQPAGAPADSPAFAKLLLDVRTGKIQVLSGGAVIQNVTLPPKYQQWRQRYGIQGEVALAGQPVRAGGGLSLEARLKDVRLRLPPEEGDVLLEHVNGTLLFEDAGVTIRQITGAIPQAGIARFEMAGRYDGYDAASPCTIKIAMKDITLPPAQQGKGLVADTLARIQRDCQPQGKLDIAAEVHRLEDGRFTFSGAAMPQGLSAAPKEFPYLLQDLRGTVAFSDEKVELRDLSASRGSARFGIQGWASLSGPYDYDIAFWGRNVPLDGPLEDALPLAFQADWKRMNLGGEASFTGRFHRRQSKEAFEVNVMMDGKTSFKYSGFPYALDDVFGGIRFTAEELSIDSLRGSHGPMRCMVRGTIKAFNTPAPDVDIHVTASDVPLDDALAAALGTSGRAAMEAVRPGGLAEKCAVVVRQSPGKPLDYDATVTLADASFNIKAFPYALSGVAGTLNISPDKVGLQDIRARHEKAAVTAKGQVYLGPTIGFEVQADAIGVTADASLQAALPPLAKEIWRQLSPSGTLDIHALVRQDTPDLPGKTDYRLLLEPRDMQVVHQLFPYRLKGISGRVLATPEGIHIEELASLDGKMKTSLKGSVVADEKGARTDLVVSAQNVPLDAELLAASPSHLAPLLGRFKPGGTCSVELKKVHLERRNVKAASAPTSGPAALAVASAPTATRPVETAETSTWNVDGVLSFSGATLDIGTGPRELSGSLTGTARQEGQGMALDAELALDSIVMENRQVKDFRGHLVKSPTNNIMRVEDFSAKAYGGMVSGLVTFALGESPQYKLSLSMEDVKLEELFNAGVTDPKKKVDVKGLLTRGTLKLTGTAGDPASMEATGELRISKASIQKLPVVLGMMQVVYLSLPGESPLSEGEVTYDLARQKLHFREIHFTGPAVSILGSGSMDLKSEAMNLTFLAGPPGKLPRLRSIADELAEGILREVVEIRVTGTMSQPVTRTVGLRSLDAAIRRLISASRGDEE